MPKPSPKNTKAEKRPKRRWRRRLVRALIWTPIVLIVGVLILGQTPVMEMIAEPMISKQTGLDVNARTIRLHPNGRIVIRDATARAPSIDGQPGEVLVVDRADIVVDWWATLRGSPALKRVKLVAPEIRLSQSNETGKLNIADMIFSTSGDGKTPMPAVRIVDGIVEIGEHDAQGYTELKRLRVSGRATRPDADGLSRFDFVALPTEPVASSPGSVGEGTLALTGSVTSDGVQATLEGFRLEDWPASIVPSRSRVIYERLALSGELASTRFRLASDGDLAVVLTLDGVDMNLPFDAEYSMTGEGELLRMRETRGTIRFATSGVTAELDGTVDELGYEVGLEYNGLNADSPFVCTIRTDFVLSDDFRPRQFLPSKVVEKLDRFQGLAMDVDASVRIERTQQDPKLDISGSASIRNGTARYKKFPYPFHDLHGTIRFDSMQIVVQRIEGVGPTGAGLVATGRFAPLGEMSKVVLNLDVTDLVIDDALKNAMSSGQQKLVEALFSEHKYAALLDDGLLLSARDRGQYELRRSEITAELDSVSGDLQSGLARELAVIERSLALPVFDFGGAVDIAVVLRRHPERPSEDRWTRQTEVRLDHAGLVPKHFPLPIIARDVLISIDDDHVELAGGRYEGISGGWAEVDVQLDLKDKDALTKPMPLVDIRVREIPIDQRLVAAIPGYRDDQGDDPDAVTIRRILDRLRLGGTVECDAVFGPRNEHQLGYDIEAMIIDGSARPMPMAELAGEDSGLLVDPLAMSNILGTVYLTEEMIVVDLDGELYAPDQPLRPTPMHVMTQLTMPAKVGGLGGVRREGGLLPIEHGPPAPGPRMYVRARADGLDLAMPLEHAVGVVSPGTARKLRDWRQRINPDGVLGVQAALEGYVGGYVETTLALDRIEHLGADLGGQRYRAGASWGRATVTLGVLPKAVLDGFRVPLTVDGVDAGELTMHGQLSLARGQRGYNPKPGELLDVSYSDGRLGSSLVRVVAGRGSENSVLSDYKLDGLFDLRVKVTPRSSRMIDAEEGTIRIPPIAMTGMLEPKELFFETNDQRVAFDKVSGGIVFSGTEGRVDGINAIGDGYSVNLNGDWRLTNPGLGVDLTIDAAGGVLDSPLRAVLPLALDRVLTDLGLGAHAPMDIKGLTLQAEKFGTDDVSFRVQGNTDILGGYALIGMPITELDGRVSFVAAGESGNIGYEIGLEADRFRAGSLRMSDGRVQIVGDASTPGVVLVPEIDAAMHGGRIAGSAQIRPSDTEESRFWTELHCSGVRAAPLFDDLLLPAGGLEGPPMPGEDRVRSAWDVDDDFSRGVLIADLSMSGIVGQPSNRTGRGSVEVAGGSVVALPGIINLIEASNLNLPIGSKLHDAEGEFYLDGNTLAFERLSATSKSIEILGYGTMDWGSKGMDLRFRSRSINRIPLLSTIIEGLRDELITTKVTGTPGNLTYSVDQFGSTKRVFNAMLGRPETDHERRLREVEQRVDASRADTKDPTQSVVHEPVSMDEPWGQWVEEKPSKE